MRLPALTPASRQIEARFEYSSEKNPLMGFPREESLRQVEASGSVPSNYGIITFRRNEQFGDEIFGPKRLEELHSLAIIGPARVGDVPPDTLAVDVHVGYSEAALYGAAGSPVVRFRSAIHALRVHAERTASVNPEEVEYGHQAALVWSEVGRLKEFIGTSPVISEIVAEFRTARFLFLGKDTPPPAMQAVASSLALIIEAKRHDAALVDRVVEILEQGGIDSLAPDMLRDTHV